MTPNAKRVLCPRHSPAQAGGVIRREIRDADRREIRDAERRQIRDAERLLQEGGDIEIVVVDLKVVALAAANLR